MGVSPKASTFDDDLALIKTTLGIPKVDELGDTSPAESPPPQPSSPKLDATIGVARTVLPRRKQGHDESVIEERPRFEMVDVLGRGGMGEVALVKDNDIRRTVAVKRLLPNQRHGDAVLRFADEVRAVGQLEHPGIVPVYDVGVDDRGDPYLVMKHVQGETLETIIEKLAKRDPETTERFTHEYRAHVFLEILQAIRYAHDRGIIHRDIKPANVMIGPFGEVTVMDWGVAKKIERRAEAASEPAPTKKSTGDGKLLSTIHGALVGTPLYMSPEQAAGRNDDLDERSDVFSLSLLFYEMLVLEHPQNDVKSLQELIATRIANEIATDDFKVRGLKARAPVEYLQFLLKGLPRDREKRFASVAAMETGLRNILSGKIPVACHISFTKKVVHAFLHWVDRHPREFSALLLLSALGIVGSIVWGVVRLFA